MAEKEKDVRVDAAKGAAEKETREAPALAVMERVSALSSKIEGLRERMRVVQERALAVHNKIPTVSEQTLAKHFGESNLKALDATGVAASTKIDELNALADEAIRSFNLFLQTPAAVSPTTSTARRKDK